MIFVGYGIYGLNGGVARILLNLSVADRLLLFENADLGQKNFSHIYLKYNKIYH